MKPVLYLDLDGVLVDFVGGALKWHGKHLPPGAVGWDFPSQIGFEGDKAKDFWAPLGFDFWANLEWTHEGQELLAGLERIFGDRIVLFTSPCETDGCVDGKRAWVKKHLPEYHRRTLLGPCKHLAAGPKKVLIDDHQDNADLFASEGGISILVPRPWNRFRMFTDEGGHFHVPLFLTMHQKLLLGVSH